MDDYISREAAMKVLDAIFDKTDPSGAEQIGVLLCRKAIRELPAAKVRSVVEGTWIGTADGYADGELVYDMWECSECGYDADGVDEKPDWSFCPKCGADMRGGGE